MDIPAVLSRAKTALETGDLDAAIAGYISVYRSAYGNGEAKAGLNRLGKDLFVKAIAVRDKGDASGAIALAVRSLELNPDSGEVRAEAERLITSADRRLPAISKLVRVRVLAS